MVYESPASLPWGRFAPALERADDALTRLDERLRNNPLAEGWAERAHYADACAALWLAGELVHLEDLVLREAAMDIRVATHALTCAAGVLHACHLAARRDPAWALSGEGINALRDRRITAPAQDLHERPSLVYDLDWNEDEWLGAWKQVLEQGRGLPALVAAALAYDAWVRIEPLQHGPWLGSLLIASLLRRRGRTKHQLLALNLGLQKASYRRSRAHDLSQRLAGFLEGIEAVAVAGTKDLDRLSLAREMMSLKLRGRRSTSRLPGLIDLFLSKPLVSVPMAAKALRVSPQAVRKMLAELEPTPREMTGRGAFRAWGII